jgi:drug/metabolite transporter (DMT)-like permease
MTPTVLAMVLVSAAIHAVWSVSIKGSHNPLAFNLVQAIPICAVFVPIAWTLDPSGLSARFFWILAAAGLAHAIYLYGLSRAFEEGDITLVYPIARSTPAFMPLVAAPLLGERISLWGAVGIATVVVGMWAVQLGRSPGSQATRRFGGGVLGDPGLRLALVALVATVGYGLTDKAMMDELSQHAAERALPASLLAFFLIWGACAVFFVPMALVRLQPGVFLATLRADWLRALLASTISVAGYGLILEALGQAEVSYVVAVRQSSVLFVLVLGVVFLHERPGWMRVAGAVATVAGVALIGLGG